LSITILGTLDQDFESLSIHSPSSCDGERPRSGILASFLDGGPPRRRAEYHSRHQVSFLQWIKTAHQAYVRASNLPMMQALLTHLTRESWLDRHHKKQRRTKCIGWLIVLFIIIVVVAIVLVVLWLLKMGIFHRRS
jgi:hypothetical protein